MKEEITTLLGIKLLKSCDSGFGTAGICQFFVNGTEVVMWEYKLSGTAPFLTETLKLIYTVTEVNLGKNR